MAQFPSQAGGSGTESDPVASPLVAALTARVAALEDAPGGAGFDLTSATWTPINLINGWRSYPVAQNDSTFAAPEYTIIGGMLIMRGVADGGQATSILWGQMPPEAVPLKNRSFISGIPGGVWINVLLGVGNGATAGKIGPFAGAIPGFVYTEGIVVL